MTQKYERVVLTCIYDTKEKGFSQTPVYTEEEYMKHWRMKDKTQGGLCELVGSEEYQVKPYFDLDPKGDFDYAVFDAFENDLIRICKDLGIKEPNVYVSGRDPRQEQEILKHSRRFYVNARITYSNIPIIFKELFDKYNKQIIDNGVYNKNRRLFSPLSQKKRNNYVPQLKVIKGSIFDNCPTYIKENYVDLDLKMTKVDKVLAKFDKVLNEDNGEDEDDNPDKYKRLQELIKHLSSKRSNSYDTWYEVGFAIFNICDKENIPTRKCHELIHQFSRLSLEKYDEIEVDKWIKQNDKPNREKGYGWTFLIHKCIKEDDPEYYKNFSQCYNNMKKEFEIKNLKIMYPPQIISLNQDETYEIQTISNFEKSLKHLKCSVKKINKKGETTYETKRFTDMWLDDPRIRTYEKNVFKPPPLVVKSHEFNGWIDFKIAKQPLVKTDRDYFKEWCEFGYNLIGNKQYAEFIIARYAQRIQFPAKRTFVCAVYYGKERIGKNKFIEPIKLIMDNYYQELDSAKKLYEKHSMYEFQKLFLCINEAQGIDNFANADVLKTRITEPEIAVNPKGIQSYNIDNYCDYDMTTNNFNVVKISDNSHNRFFQIECTRHYEGNTEFFNDYIKNIINNPIALRQIYEGLMNFNVSEIVPSGNFQKDKPKTEIEEEVKEQNRDKIICFLEDFIRNYMLRVKSKDFAIIKYKNQTLFDKWIDWLKECKITSMEHVDKQKFGIRLAGISKNTLEPDTIIKDTKHSTTTINTEKLAKFFKLDDLENNFIDEED